MMFVQLVGGFALLLVAAEFMVRGAVAIAKFWKVSPLVIGMTVVALGTSAPEVVVSVQAAYYGVPAMAIGNVVGSNIANVFLILGVAAVVAPIAITRGALTRDTLSMLAASVLFAGMCWSGVIGPLSGVILLVLFAAFLGWSYWRETHGEDPGEAEMHALEVEEFEGLAQSQPVVWAIFLGGLAGIILGSDLLVTGGTAIARAAGVSEEVIGLTLIALGTSLPELAASVVAAFRGHAEVALGNVVGSNLFNLLLVAGAAANVRELPVPEQINRFDIWVMLAAAVILTPLLIRGGTFGRLPGVMFLAFYSAYIAAQAVGVEKLLARLGV